MTVQEIEDVHGRIDRPKLDLEFVKFGAATGAGRTAEVWIQAQVINASDATASFAVITFGAMGSIFIRVGTPSKWSSIYADEHWKVWRCVIASGSSPGWSPITPGFVLTAEDFQLVVERMEQDFIRPRWIGLARLDHDGGFKRYIIEFMDEAFPEVHLVEISNVPEEFKDLGVPRVFTIPLDRRATD